MTLKEILRDNHRQQQIAHQELLEAARAAVPILKDLGHPSTSNSLAEKVFLLDALHQELIKNGRARFEESPSEAIQELIQLMVGE